MLSLGREVPTSAPQTSHSSQTHNCARDNARNADAVQRTVVVVHPQVEGKQERLQGEWSRVDATPGSSLHTLMSTNTHSNSQPATTISIVCLFLPCDGVGAPSQLLDQSFSHVENANTPQNL